MPLVFCSCDLSHNRNDSIRIYTYSQLLQVVDIKVSQSENLPYMFTNVKYYFAYSSNKIYLCEYQRLPSL